jgi:formylglycine-generating enzyme required for sulfatase activity
LKSGCRIEEAGRARTVEARDFPLAVGGAGADLPVPGIETGEPAAFLAMDGGELFVQPQPSGRIFLGGAPVTASQWLRDGDEVRLLGTRIRVAVRGDGLLLRVEHLSLDRPTEPPALLAASPAGGGAPPVLRPPEMLVRPVAYQPKAIALGPRGPRGPRRRPSTAAIAVAIPLTLAGAFVLAARSVEVKVEPEPARLSVRSWLQVPFGRTRLLLPGHYTVVAQRAGYKTLEAALEVSGERRQVATFALEKLPGMLAVEASPASGVRVLVDGLDRGTTPLGPLELSPGEHNVVLRAEGYAPFSTRLTLAGGGESETLRATLVPDRAAVSFASDPAGASVRVDGDEVGRTPLTRDLSSGVRGVEIVLAGHRPATRRITVVAEHPMSLPVFRLEPLPGRFSLTSEPPGAAVSVDGEFRGETPAELDLLAGKAHAIRLTKAGHDAADASVTLDRGEARALALTLAPRLGEVEVAAEPADAEVLVDGEARGRVGQTLRLTAMPHAIEVRRPGYEPHRVTLTPRPGFPQAVRVRLRSFEEVKEIARPPVLRPASGHELRLLTTGRFQMGASRREPGRRANETLREVELVRPFYLAVREVTNAQFHRFKADHSSGRLGAHDLGGDAHPVVSITWEDAAAYCNWLSQQEGLPPAYVTREGKLAGAQPLNAGYRLPTEAEWSRAARYPEGGPLKYPWGNALPIPPKAGNYADESARPLVPVVLQGYDDRHPASAPAGSFPPNALGLFDLGGNVAEWVHDAYVIPPAEGPVERDPVGPAGGELHVILGSSYLQGTVTELRLSYRDYGTKARPDLGFRVARYAE